MRGPAIILAIIVLCAGCTLYERPRASTPDVVARFAMTCARTDLAISPAGYVAAGLTLVDQECTAFFDNIVLLQKSSRFAGRSVGTIGTQTAVILQALEQSATTLAIVAATSEIIVKLIEGFAQEYAFAPYAANVRGIVFSALEQYKETDAFRVAMRELELRSQNPEAFCFAQNMVQNYAKICTIASIEAFAQQAIARSDAERTKPPGDRKLQMAVATLNGNLVTPSGGLYRTLQMPNFEAGPSQR